MESTLSSNRLLLWRPRWGYAKRSLLHLEALSGSACWRRPGACKHTNTLPGNLLKDQLQGIAVAPRSFWHKILDISSPTWGRDKPALEELHPWLTELMMESPEAPTPLERLASLWLMPVAMPVYNHCSQRLAKRSHKHRYPCIPSRLCPNTCRRRATAQHNHLDSRARPWGTDSRKEASSTAWTMLLLPLH